MSNRPRIGIALGSGSARGWAHIGVLRALAAEGVVPDLICGCSIGSFVGAAYADGDLDALESWVTGLTPQDVLGLLDVRLRSGLIKGDRLMRFFSERFVGQDFASLAIPFACVATDLQTGREEQVCRMRTVDRRALQDELSMVRRLDGHPNWDRNFNRIIFQAAPHGKRQLYVAGMRGLITA